MDNFVDKSPLSTTEARSAITQFQHLLDDTEKRLLVLCDASTPMAERDNKQTVIDDNIAQMRNVLARPIGKDKVPFSELLGITLQDLALDRFSIANAQCLQTLRQVMALGERTKDIPQADVEEQATSTRRFAPVWALIVIGILAVVLLVLQRTFRR
jgi:hypothetical protein